LKNLIMEGGVPTNPIVVDDTEEVEEVVTHSHESLDSHDELTADDLPIVIEDDVIEDDVIDEDQEETITLDQKVDIGKVEANENENELEYEGFDGSAYVEEEVEGQVDEVEYDAYDDAELHDLDADLQEAGADGLVYEDEIDGQTYTIVAAGYEKEADADPLDPEHAKDYQDIAEQGDAHIELEITNDQIIDTEGGQEQDDVEVDQDYLEEEQYLEQELEPELVQDSAQDIEGDMIENIPPQDHVIEKNTPMEVVLDPSFKTFLVEENDITENGKRELDVTTSPGIFLII
jgi:hypothetical protein